MVLNVHLAFASSDLLIRKTSAAASPAIALLLKRRLLLEELRLDEEVATYICCSAPDTQSFQRPRPRCGNPLASFLHFQDSTVSSTSSFLNMLINCTSFVSFLTTLVIIPIDLTLMTGNGTFHSIEFSNIITFHRKDQMKCSLNIKCGPYCLNLFCCGMVLSFRLLCLWDVKAPLVLPLRRGRDESLH